MGKPNCLTEETWQKAGNAGLWIEEKDDQIEVYDQAGYTFPDPQTRTLSPDQAESWLKNALARPFPDPSYYKR